MPGQSTPATSGDRLARLVLRRETLRQQLTDIRSELIERSQKCRQEITAIDESILDCAKHAAQTELDLGER